MADVSPTQTFSVVENINYLIFIFNNYLFVHDYVSSRRGELAGRPLRGTCCLVYNLVPSCGLKYRIGGKGIGKRGRGNRGLPLVNLIW